MNLLRWVLWILCTPFLVLGSFIVITVGYIVEVVHKLKPNKSKGSIKKYDSSSKWSKFKKKVKRLFNKKAIGPNDNVNNAERIVYLLKRED